MSALTCKCVGCGHKETFTPIPTGVPMCPKCFSPMFAMSVAAEAREVADGMFERAFGRKP